MPDRTVFLVRHGEVWNPDHVVYADRSGFGLSPRGGRQVALAAARLSSAPVRAIVTSPLRRAWETAAVIALRCGVRPVGDGALTEWRLSNRWAATAWEELPRRFPGELEAYLTTPEDLPFSPESLAAVAERTTAAIERWSSRVDGPAVFVTHQDPLQAAVLTLTGRDLATLHHDKPGHAAVVALQHGSTGWIERSRWEPEQGPPFPPPSATTKTNPTQR